MARSEIEPNPYLLAVLTAVLSGFFAVGGIYLTSELAKSRAVEGHTLETRAAAYMAFLKRTKSDKGAVIARIQYAGTLARNSATDGEVQEVEDYLATISSHINADLLVELNQEFNLLRSVGSDAVRSTVEDLFLALAHRVREINIRKYSKDFQMTFILWNPDRRSLRPEDVSPDIRPHLLWLASLPESGEPYLKEKVSDEDRFMIVLASMLFDELFFRMNVELNPP